MKSVALSLFMCLYLLTGRAQRASGPELKSLRLSGRSCTQRLCERFQLVSQCTEFPLVVKRKSLLRYSCANHPEEFVVSSAITLNCLPMRPSAIKYSLPESP